MNRLLVLAALATTLSAPLAAEQVCGYPIDAANRLALAYPSAAAGDLPGSGDYWLSSDGTSSCVNDWAYAEPLLAPTELIAATDPMLFEQYRAGLRVERLWAMLVLDSQGLLPALEAWRAAPERTAAERIYYDEASWWNRNDAMVAAVGQLLGMTDEELDALFEAAIALRDSQ